MNRVQRWNMGWQGVALGMSLSGIAIAQEPPAAPKEAVVAIPLNPNLHYYFPPEKVVKRTLSADVCIYGATSCGIIAAVELAQLGRKVVLIEPSAHLGGMTTGGLSNTDIGNKAAIGGLSREFYHRVGQKYGEEEEWRFEPHVADEVYAAMLKEAAVPIYTKEYLHSVRKQGNRITSLLTESGLTVRARCFIDATYEGDLMAQAKVHYVVGRESNTVYGETLDGAQTRDKHQFDAAVDPYVRAGDPASGLLPGIDPTPAEANGTGDARIQAYNFRLCMATTAENRLPFPKPEGYDPAQYQLLARYLATGWNQVFQKFDPIRNSKTDTNNHGAISTDFIGQNYAWPEADYRTRERIFRAHVVYQQGWAWFLANDPSVPEAIRTKMNTFGLCRDEFTETGGWSPQLYVREARRMVSDYVMTEANCRGERTITDPVGLAAYTMDSHNCRRFVRDGRVWNEGDVQVGGMPPYPISYRAIVPKKAECANLFVPVCLAASHIAYGSIRMEPVFMILGQSAALAADIALTDNIAVQEVDYGKLRFRLEAAHQILEWKRP
ncbi:MAG: xly [Chthonomonadaceae bacterium]|nr:xly [Chthonomonadaceae bacterium]